MHETRSQSKTWRSVLLISGLLAVSGCREGTAREQDATARSTQAQVEGKEGGGTRIPLEKLPFVDGVESTRMFTQQLKEPTALGENAVLHVKLPQPHNKELQDSLVRVLGEPKRPLVMFRSDALEQLGLISASPGKEFFTTFTQLPESEVKRRLENEELLAAGKLGEVTSQRILFDGRRPVGITQGIPFDLDRFRDHQPVHLNLCPLMPVSNEQSWGRTLFITDPAVVQDLSRTWDPCTGIGTPGGKWTFAHMMREMAMGSGSSAEDFVKDWLSRWLNDYTLNGDVVAARPEMFDEVIKPWAIASGATATLNVDPVTGHRSVDLGGGSLNLSIAPFRLLAIVNRVDLGATTSGPGGYGGGTSERPVDAGELRFVFGVVQPSPWGAGGSEATCGRKRFTAIFEYGVPRTGCQAVVQWARDWADLNNLGGFSSAYLTKLETLTESVVTHNAAPAKGNGSALNQIRTNENALDPNLRWELREFALKDEDFVADMDTPSNGLLRPHTVALTPDDGVYNPSTPPAFHPSVDTFVMNTVRPAVKLSPAPNNCSASFKMPARIGGVGFRGGNSLVSPPTHWVADVDSTVADQACARFQFSSNTCNGCHRADTATVFTHVDPLSSIPVTLSNFLTGGGAGSMHSVPDAQFGPLATPPLPTEWKFADLQRRFERLHELARCTQCNRVLVVHPDFLDVMRDIAGVVPVDPVIRPEKLPFPVGPIRDLEVVKQLVERRVEFKEDFRDEPMDFIRPAETFAH